jgi:hypothetical protein
VTQERQHLYVLCCAILWFLGGIALMAFSCSCASRPEPTCERSIAHYYDVGCGWTDALGKPYDVHSVIGECLYVLSVAPVGCLDGVLACLGEASAGDCDCGEEIEAYYECWGGA